MIVRFKQIDKYPDSLRSIGAIITVDTEPLEKPVLAEEHKAADVKVYAQKLAEYESKKEWAKRYIKYLETYPNIYKRLEEGEE